MEAFARDIYTGRTWLLMPPPAKPESLEAFRKYREANPEDEYREKSEQSLKDWQAVSGS